MSVSEQFEQLINDKLINFNQGKLSDLPRWGQMLVHTFLEPAHISWLIGDVRIGAAVCLKLDDPVLQYLDILTDTEQFMWCIDDHHDSMHPDDASAYLLSKHIPGIAVECIRDDKTRTMVVTLADGRQVIIDDLRKTEKP